jgi:hypothetical protein
VEGVPEIKEREKEKKRERKKRENKVERLISLLK